MPRKLRSSNQDQLDFKVRKNASSRVSRKERKDVSPVKNTKQGVSPIKRVRVKMPDFVSPEKGLLECRVTVEKLSVEDCSPSKKVKSDVKYDLDAMRVPVTLDFTPKKSATPRKLQFDGPLTPKRNLSLAAASPVRSSPRLRRKMSPSKENTPTKGAASPQKCRALTFTPSKSGVQQPQGLSPRLSLHHRAPEGVLTPRKIGHSENIMSPVRQKEEFVFKTPSKAAPRTPYKRAIFASPTRSPVRSLNTPTKVPCCPLLSPGGIPLSPRKQSLRSPCKAVRAFEERCYQEARKALHATQPANLIGRDAEMEQINDFIESHVCAKSPGSLYISGAPGTGKTACVTELRHGLQNQKSCKEVYINCMSFKNSQAIFNRILSEIQQKTVAMTMKAALQQLEKLLVSKGPMVVCILDEVDQLDSKHQEVLYTMFEWPSLPNSRLVLVGIANALDLTDRVLPRLQGHKCQPQLLHFAPYSKQQIIAVLENRLSSSSVLEPAALKFCAMKVATVAGDMRKALDICRRAIELAEVELRKNKVCATPEKYGAPVKKIGIAHVMKIINEVYGNRAGGATQARRGGSGAMPIQQKLAVCTLLLMLKNTKAKQVTLGKLHEKYSMVCRRQQVAPSEESEFTSLCTLVEARGIICIKKAKDVRMSKVTLKLDEGELEHALQDKVLMSNILQQGL